MYACACFCVFVQLLALVGEVRRQSLRPTPRRSRGISAALLIGGGCFVCFACALADEGRTNFRQDVLLCEEAVAHLKDCCPGLDDVYAESCEYRQDGCSEGKSVALSVSQSRCVRDKECGELVDQGICERAATVLVDGAEFVDASNGNPVQVCQ